MAIMQHPRTWEEVTKTIEDPFQAYHNLLIDIGTNEIAAEKYFLLKYRTLRTPYDDLHIFIIFATNLAANQKKYSEYVKLHDTDFDILNPLNVSEKYTHTRTPDLTSVSESEGESSSSSERNQMLTTTTTPGTTTTTTHSVNPYDNTGLRSESQDVSTDDGESTTTQAYSGNPDSAETTSSATSTVTTTGTETIEHELIRVGNDGRYTLSQLIDDAALSADKLNFLDIICEDIANRLFIQVW